MDPAEALTLVALTYRGCEYNLSNAHSRWVVCNELKKCLARFASKWTLGWGPAGYRPGPVGLDISSMYAAYTDASNLAIVIRGTNLFSVVDWISNLPLEPMHWEYGAAASDVNITRSTWLGLRLLQRLQCGPIPTQDPGESLAEKLQAEVAKAQAAIGYAFITRIMQGATLNDAARYIAEISNHIGGLSSKASAASHAPVLHHAFVDAQLPPPSSGTMLEFMRVFIAAAPSPANLYVIGHSKSGPLAAAFAQWLADIAPQWDATGKAELHVYTFAGPTPGNDKFAGRYLTSGIDECRFENKYDIVPHVWDPAEMRQISGLYDDQLAALKGPIDAWAAALESSHYRHEVTDQPRVWKKTPQSNFLQRATVEHLDGYLKAFGLYDPNSFNILTLFAPI